MSVPATWALFRRTAGEGNHSPGEWKDTGLRDDVAANLKRRWIEQGGTTDWQEFNYRLVLSPIDGAAGMISYQVKFKTPNDPNPPPGHRNGEDVHVRLTILNDRFAVERRGRDARDQEAWLEFMHEPIYSATVYWVLRYITGFRGPHGNVPDYGVVDCGTVTVTYQNISGEPHYEWTPPKS